MGFLNLYGIVSTVGAVEVSEDEENLTLPPLRGKRLIEVQLVGEAYARDYFQRGISVYPTIDDEAHIVTAEDLAIIYGSIADISCIQIGWHAASESLPALVNLDKLVSRHCAIVGSTGSGKSNTVAQLLKSLTDGRYPGARVILMDLHGEYYSALKDASRVFRIDDPANPLYIPFWTLTFDELAWFLVDRKSGTETIQDSNLRGKIFEQKRSMVAKIKAGHLDDNLITVDSPIPFCIKDTWYYFDRAERVTYEDMARTQEALIEEGDAKTLKSARFKPPGAGSSPPFKPSGVTGQMLQYISKIYARLKDRRFDFILSPGEYDGLTKDLDDLLASWVDHDRPISIFDLSGVPFEVTDLAIGTLVRLLFDYMFWGRNMPGTGRQRPILFIFEEAHSYLPKGGGRFIQGYALRAVQRVFKEGRKYGLGAIVVSQRPSELDESILSQCGTIFAMRLSNSADQGYVKSVVPDSLASLLDLVPALRTGEVLVLGEAVQIPSRIKIAEVSPRPDSADPEISKSWCRERMETARHDTVVTAWRQQKLPKVE